MPRTIINDVDAIKIKFIIISHRMKTSQALKGSYPIKVFSLFPLYLCTGHILKKKTYLGCILWHKIFDFRHNHFTYLACGLKDSNKFIRCNQLWQKEMPEETQSVLFLQCLKINGLRSPRHQKSSRIASVTLLTAITHSPTQQYCGMVSIDKIFDTFISRLFVPREMRHWWEPNVI